MNDKSDAELLRDLETVTAEHFLTEEDLVEFLNDECKLVWWSSRMCERGTKGCDVRHDDE